MVHLSKYGVGELLLGVWGLDMALKGSVFFRHHLALILYSCL